METADNRHDRGCDHEQVARYGNTGEEGPILEHVSEDGARKHSRPKGKEERMEHPKDDESPFDLSEDGPPTLRNTISKVRKKMGRDLTEIIHGVMIWNAIVSFGVLDGPETGVLTTARTKNAAWSDRTLPSRLAIKSQERRSIHIPTAKTVKNAASCRNAENDKAICGRR